LHCWFTVYLEIPSLLVIS